jgi:hypothetical protein
VVVETDDRRRRDFDVVNRIIARAESTCRSPLVTSVPMSPWRR